LRLNFTNVDKNFLNKFWVQFPKNSEDDLAKFRSFLSSQGIEAENMYIPLHLKKENLKDRHADLTNTPKNSEVICSLPIQFQSTEYNWRRIE